MFTIYNEEENKYQLVEEPDPSLSYTYADYLQWKFEERVELFKGRISKMSPTPNTKHQIVAGNLFVYVKNFLKTQKCQVFIAPFDVRLPVRNKKRDADITTVVQPDICVVCDELKIDECGCCGAPDLVIEIISPGNSKKEVRLKFDLYQEAGVKEYWIVNPVEENLVIYIMNASGEYEGGKMYAGGDVIKSFAIKGFEIEVNEIFIK